MFSVERSYVYAGCPLYSAEKRVGIDFAKIKLLAV